MNGGITLDLSEFRSTLREYSEYTKRDLATILNTKGFYISRGAVRDTHRVEASTIETELRNLLRPEGAEIWSKSTARTVTRFDSVGRSRQVPLVSLLVNAQRGRKGQPGLKGADMQQASDSFIGRRVRSRAFIASGFIPSIKAFEPLAEKKGQAPPRDSEVKERGLRKLGYGIPATPGWTPFAVIANAAFSYDDNGKALEVYGTRGLQLAVNDEVKSMREYIERKMQETANKVNTK